MSNIELRQIFAAQIALLQSAIKIIDGAAPEAEPEVVTGGVSILATPEVTDPIYDGMTFRYTNGMNLTVVDSSDQSVILCTSRVTVISNGFENVQNRDVRLSRNSVLSVLPRVGAMFMVGDEEHTIQVVNHEDGLVYGVVEGEHAFIMDYAEVQQHQLF